MYNIILEGCDCVGKSSIFDKIMHRGLLGEKMIGFQCKNRMPPKSYEDGKQLNEEILHLSNKFDGIVFDRHILSEKVYAPILRNYYPDYISKLEKQLKPHNYLFLITADLEVVRNRFDGKEITLELIPRILKDYKRNFHNCYYPNKIIIDTTNITSFQALEKIEETIKNNQGL